MSILTANNLYFLLYFHPTFSSFFLSFFLSFLLSFLFFYADITMQHICLSWVLNGLGKVMSLTPFIKCTCITGDDLKKHDCLFSNPVNNYYVILWLRVCKCIELWNKYCLNQFAIYLKCSKSASMRILNCSILLQLSERWPCHIWLVGRMQFASL